MAYADKVDARFFAVELVLNWLALSLEFNKTPKEQARLEKCVWRKGELIFNFIEDKLKIRKGSSPYTVAKKVADYITETGYAKVEIHKVSDTELYRDWWEGTVIRPMLQKYRPKGLKVTPMPAPALIYAALKKLCNMKVKVSEISKAEQAKVPKGVERQLWTLSPIK
ncbi:MAG: hypothetical protein HYY41_04855 [Chloroflexi bacterium]|nr:hypothetical protein [Chloroflexota bacterium]MBI2980141.1 hypothetical protein [Chloroflexota bacterium]